MGFEWDKLAKRKPDLCMSLRGKYEDVLAEYDRVKNLILFNGEGTLLDVCCGDGMITNMLTSDFKSVVGVDISKELLSRARASIKAEKYNNVSYVNSEAAILPIADDAFDFTICLSAFHYFPGYDYAELTIKELVRITRPSGTILITEVPSKDAFWYFVWRLIRNNDPDKEAVDFFEFEKMPFLKRLYARGSLILRRYTGEKVDSDDWLWYEKHFFQAFGKDKFKKITVNPSLKKGFWGYRFDVMFSNI